ncbi:MAG TPA: CHAT domain-containing protein [Pyrinomonadaceae bacterium]|jgi:tetratricopeptide (TPR) repeat protein
MEPQRPDQEAHRPHPPFTVKRAHVLVAALLLLAPAVAAGQHPAVKPQRDARAAKSAPEQARFRALEYGATARRPLAGGEGHTYAASAHAGQYLRVVVEQQGIDVAVSLLSADGGVLVKADNANGTRGTESVSLAADGEETFRVKVEAREPRAKSGYYTIRIAEQHVATAEDARRVRAERALAAGESLRADGSSNSLNQSLARYQEAYELFSAARDAAGAATALLDMGKSHYFLLDMEEAARKYGEAMKLYEAAGLRLDEGVARLYVGQARLALGDNAEALGFYERALELFTAEDDERFVSFALNEMGRAYYLRGDVNKALDYYGRALPIRHDLNDRKGESFTLVAMGRAYSNGFGDDARARELYQQALKLQREIGNDRLAAQTLGDLGRLDYKAGDYDAALKNYNEALVAVANGDQGVKAEILTYIGLVYSAWGRHADAVERYFSPALKLQEGRDPVGRARTLQYMGRAYASLGDDAKGLEHLNAALEVWQRVLHRTAEADTRHDIAVVESRRGRFAEASRQIRAALPVIESLRTETANQSLRNNYFASAQDYYELYIDVLMRWSAQTGDKSLEALALKVSESKRARSLLDILVEARADVRGSVSDPGLLDREAALQRELSAQSLRQMIGEHLTPEQAAGVRKKLDTLVAEFYELDAEIRKKSPHYASLTRPAPVSVEEMQGGLLARDQALLEYSLGDERSYLWAVTPDSVRSYVLPGRAEVEAAVVKLVKALTARNIYPEGETETARAARVERADAEYGIAAAAMGKLLALDRAAAATGAERLLIVADGELQYVPFAALLVPARHAPGGAAQARQGFGEGETLLPLLFYHEIEEPPSMSVVAELRRARGDAERPLPSKTIAVIADPVFSADDERCCKSLPGGGAGRGGSERSRPTERLAARARPATRGEGAPVGARTGRLGFTRLEAEEILALFPRDEWLKAVGFEANLSLLTDPHKLAPYRILHLATHGLLDSEHPELSGILLSMLDEHGRQQNGFLQVHQIYNLRLPAEMLVLSACDTGIGKRMKGEGLNGISRGFMYAGVKRVVASLWEVNDASTSQLMKNFYQSLQPGAGGGEKMRPAAAMREAQLQVMKHRIWRHPYYWAAFVVQG